MTFHSAVQPLPKSFRERTIFDLIDRGARDYPNRLAVVAESALESQVRLTYAQLTWSIDKAADALRSAGVREGDHVGILLSNEAACEFVRIAFGAMRLGAVVVPLNTRYVATEQLYSVTQMDCRVLVYESVFGETVRQIAPELLNVKAFIEVGANVDNDALSWSALYASGRAEERGFPEIGEDDLADILLTSGTTGLPKGVMLTHSNAVATGVAIAGALGLRATDVYQSAFPLFTSSGFHFNLMSVLTAGATIVIEPRFDVAEMLERITQERSTVYLGVPAAYIFMMEVYDQSQHDASSIRLFDYGGAPMAKDVIRQLSSLFPSVELRQTYGLTESGPTGTYLTGDLSLTKLGSIGREMPLCKVRCVTPDLSSVAVGEIGEIVMCGPAIMRGYYKNAEATAASIHDGWLWSGDLGTVDEDGFLYYVDRNKDIIIRGGFNISSMEVENVLFEYPHLQEVAVVAVPHAKLGEDVCAFVVPRKNMQLDIKALQEFCSERLADYKVPRQIVLIDELPRNPTGKIQKNVLREKAVSLN
jgi:acyl-CoA synthetase (AMP-forming)/AMP-acid ligase II